VVSHLGPIIILDKSAFQSLTLEEVEILEKFYYINIPPILVLEIIGDLAKTKKQKMTPEESISLLSHKIRGINSKASVHYKDCLVNDLLNGKVPMEGRIPVYTDSEIVMPSGERGVMISDSKEELDLLRWSQSSFSKDERDFSKLWRGVIKNIPLERIRNALRKEFHGQYPEASTMEELIEIADNFLKNQLFLRRHILALMEDFSIPRIVIKEVMHRLNRFEGFQNLEQFAPYAFYLAKADLLFLFALIFEFIGTRSTNRIDLEYLFYLPFCYAFVSNDKDQLKLANCLIREDQDVIQGSDFKKDLNSILEKIRSLDKEPLSDKAYLEDEDSITYRIWEKHCKEKPILLSTSINLTNEQKERFKEEVLPKIEALRKAREKTVFKEE
jgi:hypothetical protein